MTSDDARLTRLYEKHNRSIRAYCIRRVGDADAGDAVAAVFAVAWRRIGDVPVGDMALPWLYGVARRVVADHHRSQRRRRRLTERLHGLRPIPVAEPEWQLVQRAEYRQVHAALASMRDKDREILLLASWEELSTESIAVVLGCSPQAAAQRLLRATRKLGKAYRALQESPQAAQTTRGDDA